MRNLAGISCENNPFITIQDPEGIPSGFFYFMYLCENFVLWTMMTTG
jgi:hypothetical protein